MGWYQKILEHVGFNIEDEELDQDYTGIISNRIGQMGIDIKNGVLFYNSSKKKEEVIQVNFLHINKEMCFF